MALHVFDAAGDTHKNKENLSGKWANLYWSSLCNKYFKDFRCVTLSSTAPCIYK